MRIFWCVSVALNNNDEQWLIIVFKESSRFPKSGSEWVQTDLFMHFLEFTFHFLNCFSVKKKIASILKSALFAFVENFCSPKIGAKGANVLCDSIKEY